LRDEPPTVRAGVDAATSLLLDDVERGAAQWASADLAAGIQAELRAVRGRDLDRGVRQDAHHVLLGATIPAVLVEVGFLDHPLEGRELLDPDIEDRIADALAKAIAAQVAR
jgi:N-acetylmuramoyl-L-alanine amidase